MPRMVRVCMFRTPRGDQSGKQHQQVRGGVGIEVSGTRKTGNKPGTQTGEETMSSATRFVRVTGEDGRAVLCRSSALPPTLLVNAQADARQWDTSATAKARTNCGTPLLEESMDLNKNRMPEISTGHQLHLTRETHD
jgi:hypothetical protein